MPIMEPAPIPPRSPIQITRLLLLCLLAAESLLLSTLHHRFNFWGWPLDKQVIIIVFVAPAAAYLMNVLLSPLMPQLRQVKPQRWFLFLLPAAIIAALTAWYFLALPEVRHSLEIIPSLPDGSSDVQIQEIRGAYGNVVPLPAFKDIPGWALNQGRLTASGAAPAPIHYSFTGPVNEQVRLIFLTSPHVGRVMVRLDGQQVALDLAGPGGRAAARAAEYAIFVGPSISC